MLGFSLSRIGFASWDQVHAMFVFTDLRLFLTFLSGVVALTAAWPIVARFATGKWPQRPIHPGTLTGSALFGVGWALCGACPAISLVQLGEGQLGALFTLAGVFAGNWLYAVVHERYFRWTMRSCAEE
jgi:uncharacterized membrane protein YedE/YeeE